MGKDRASRVASAARGLGLYRRAGRDGYFFIKNLAAQAKRYPGRIKPSYVDEQIKRADGTLVTSQKEAEAYCHRRNGQIQEMLMTLAGDTIDYSGADLEAIAQQLASQWISSKQRGINLQNLEAERLKLLARYGDKEIARWVEARGGGGLLVMSKSDDASAPSKQKTISAQELREEGKKLEKLCWDNGFRPNDEALLDISWHFSRLVEQHLNRAIDARRMGRLKAPKPSFPDKGATWEALLQAKREEGIAVGTMTGMQKAIERLQGWTETNYAIHLPGTLDGEVARKYRSWLFSTDSGLSSSSVGKDLRYLNSLFNAAVKQELLVENPFKNLPKDRRAAMQQKIDARKTVDANKIINPEEALAIFERMNSDKRGSRDASFDLFYLQAVTGTRIQEVAGLRRCDFTERSFKGKIYRCIEIRRWSQRGLAVLGDRGGLKNPQSERIVPLPKCAEAIWEKLTDPKSKEPAFPTEAPRTNKAHWGDNLARRMRDKIPDFPGTHCWRETMINNLLNSAVPTRIVEMVTGKTGNTPLSQYTSDDLPSMATAIEIHAQHLNLPTAE